MTKHLTDVTRRNLSIITNRTERGKHGKIKQLICNMHTEHSLHSERKSKVVSCGHVYLESPWSLSVWG